MLDLRQCGWPATLQDLIYFYITGGYFLGGFFVLGGGPLKSGTSSGSFLGGRGEGGLVVGGLDGSLVVGGLEGALFFLSSGILFYLLGLFFLLKFPLF
jgi:hypothetical protein